MAAPHITPPDHDLERLSAYLDGELSDRERASLEQRLKQDTDLRAALDDLRATVAMVRDLPPLKAPRNFTLDPALYSRPIPWWKRMFTLGSMLQFSGAVGTVAAVMIIASAFLSDGYFASDEASAPVAVAPTRTLDPIVTPMGFKPTMTAFAAEQATAIANANTDAAAFDATLVAQSAMYASTEIFATMTADAIVQAFEEAATEEAIGFSAGDEGLEGEIAAGAAAPQGSPLPDEPAFMQMPAPSIDADTSAEPLETMSDMADSAVPGPAGAMREAAATATLTKTPTQEPMSVAAAPQATSLEPEEQAKFPDDSSRIEPAEEQRGTEEDNFDDTAWLAGLGAILLVVSLAVFGMGLRRSRRA